MKKFLSFIVCLMAIVSFSSCSTYMATANYDVCYPDGTKTYKASTLITSSTKPIVVCYSIQGTNYIGAVDNVKNVKNAEKIASSTAPMRLNSFKVEKVKQENKFERPYNW